MLEEFMDERVRFYEIWIWELGTYVQEKISRKQEVICPKDKDLWAHGWACGIEGIFKIGERQASSKTDLQQAGCVLPTGQILEEFMEERVFLMRHLSSENLIEHTFSYRTPNPRSKLHTSRPARPWTHNHFPFRKNASCLIEVCLYGFSILKNKFVRKPSL